MIHNELMERHARQNVSAGEVDRVFDTPRYLQSSFSLFFAQQRDMIRHESMLNKSLRGNYFPAQQFTAPGESTPTLIFASQHGHSQILVSTSHLALNVNYSPDWQVDESKGRDYLLERTSLAFHALESCGEDLQFLYCGCVIRSQAPSSATDEAILSFLVQRIANPRNDGPYQDLVLRTTTVVDDVFFDNVVIQNYRVWNTSFMHVSNPRLSSRHAAERGVEIVVDFNSRHAFNEDLNFDINADSVASVIGLGHKSMGREIESLGGK